MRQYTVSATAANTIPALYRALLRHLSAVAEPTDAMRLRKLLSESAEAVRTANTVRFTGIDPIAHSLTTALALAESISPDRSMAVAVILSEPCMAGVLTEEDVEREWGDDVARLIRGLLKVSSLYGHHAAATDTENFRSLLLTFAEDIRVIIIMIVERLILMRAINHHPDDESVRLVACEAGYLYAPLAHRLGLYAIKSELEDMSLKYTNR